MTKQKSDKLFKVKEKWWKLKEKFIKAFAILFMLCLSLAVGTIVGGLVFMIVNAYLCSLNWSVICGSVIGIITGFMFSRLLINEYYKVF